MKHNKTASFLFIYQILALLVLLARSMSVEIKTNTALARQLQKTRPVSFKWADIDPNGTSELEELCEPDFLIPYVSNRIGSDNLDLGFLVIDCLRAANSSRIKVSNFPYLLLLNIKEEWICESLSSLQLIAIRNFEAIRHFVRDYPEYVYEMLIYYREITAYNLEITKDVNLREIQLREINGIDVSIKRMESLNENLINVKGRIIKSIEDLNKRRRAAVNFKCDLEVVFYNIQVKIKNNIPPNGEVDVLNSILGRVSSFQNESFYEENVLFGFYKWAQLLAEINDIDSSIESVNSMLDKQPVLSNEQILFSLKLLREKKDNKSIEPMLKMGVVKNKSDAWFHRELIKYFLNNNKVDEAVRSALFAVGVVKNKHEIFDVVLEVFFLSNNFKMAVNLVNDVLLELPPGSAMVLYVKTMLLIRMEFYSSSLEEVAYVNMVRSYLIFEYGWDFEKMYDNFASRLIFTKNENKKTNFVTPVFSEKLAAFQSIEIFNPYRSYHRVRPVYAIGHYVVSIPFLVSMAYLYYRFKYKIKNRKEKEYKSPSSIRPYLELEYENDQNETKTKKQPAQNSKSTSVAREETSLDAALSANEGRAPASRPVEKQTSKLQTQEETVNLPKAEQEKLIEIIWDEEDIPSWNAAQSTNFIKLTQNNGKPLKTPTYLFVVPELRDNPQRGERFFNKLAGNEMKDAGGKLVINNETVLPTEYLIRRTYDKEQRGKRILEYKVRFRIHSVEDTGWFGRAVTGVGRTETGKQVSCTLWVFDKEADHDAETTQNKQGNGVGRIISIIKEAPTTTPRTNSRPR